MHALEHYAGWLAHDGKHGVVDGIAYTIHAKTYTTRYPYREEVITVTAEPCNKQSKYYRTIKAQLEGDWYTEILDSDPETFVKFMTAAEAA
jgi:hypothetical protein